jgi:uncharacterized protein YecE (DUF72 family)
MEAKKAASLPMQKELPYFENRPEKPHRQSLIRIGCAGWGLSSANKHFFPDMMSHLESYAAVLPCVEINTSFYRPHRVLTYARWRDSVPDSFRFSVKLPRTITHFKRLRDCDSELAEFLDSVCALEHKWACLLVQFPPSFQFPRALAQQFFSSLREQVPADIVCEPRHRSWFEGEVQEWMADIGVAYVEADPPVALLGSAIKFSPTLQYIRLHGSPHIYHSSYSETYLNELAQRLQTESERGRRSWCIFDNTASGAAIENALFLHSRCMEQNRYER